MPEEAGGGGGARRAGVGEGGPEAADKVPRHERALDDPVGAKWPVRARPVRRARRAPVVADIVADTLRGLILRGELADGDELPMQDELIRRFEVSKAAVREALRVLEAEGLVTVRRGAVGGAVVHAPTTRTVAYALAMLLEAQGATLSDVGGALRNVEPACAVLATQRPDFRRAVLPKLRQAHEEMARVLGDGPQAVSASRRWHEQLVSSCGNRTLIAVTGVLETLWTEHESSWALGAAEEGTFPPLDVRVQAWEQHGDILDRMAAGDVNGVADAVRRHLADFQQYPLSTRADIPVQAVELRRHLAAPRRAAHATSATSPSTGA